MPKKAVLETTEKTTAIIDLSKDNQAPAMYIFKLLLTANNEKAKEFWKATPERLDFLLKKYSQTIDLVSYAKQKQRERDLEETLKKSPEEILGKQKEAD
jgi:hypothetical protein